MNQGKRPDQITFSSKMAMIGIIGCIVIFLIVKLVL